jgi:hypothetical protein
MEKYSIQTYFNITSKNILTCINHQTSKTNKKTHIENEQTNDEQNKDDQCIFESRSKKMRSN